jgi:hypothetical protein
MLNYQFGIDTNVSDAPVLTPTRSDAARTDAGVASIAIPSRRRLRPSGVGSTPRGWRAETPPSVPQFN